MAKIETIFEYYAIDADRARKFRIIEITGGSVVRHFVHEWKDNHWVRTYAKANEVWAAYGREIRSKILSGVIQQVPPQVTANNEIRVCPGTRKRFELVGDNHIIGIKDITTGKAVKFDRSSLLNIQDSSYVLRRIKAWLNDQEIIREEQEESFQGTQQVEMPRKLYTNPPYAPGPRREFWNSLNEDYSVLQKNDTIILNVPPGAPTTVPPSGGSNVTEPSKTPLFSGFTSLGGCDQTIDRLHRHREHLFDNGFDLNTVDMKGLKATDALHLVGKTLVHKGNRKVYHVSSVQWNSETDEWGLALKWVASGSPLCWQSLTEVYGKLPPSERFKRLLDGKQVNLSPIHEL